MSKPKGIYPFLLVYVAMEEESFQEY